MVKIGITGGIGSGKTTVCNLFAALSVPVYDADTAAKELIETVLRPQIEDLLGKEAFLPDGSYNRNWVAGRVFTRQELLESLNQIVHPAVKQHFECWLESQAHAAYVLKEAALLYETGSFTELDAVILVLAPLELRIERIKKRDPHRSQEQILEIITKQASDEDKLKIARYVIDNGQNSDLPEQVKEIDKQIRINFGLET